MASRTRWFGVIALATALLVFAGAAQAKQKDDGDVIVCKTLASCLADISQPGGDGDLTGTDASSLGSVVNSDGGDNADSSSATTQEPSSSSGTSPQVVTVPMLPVSGTVTTNTTVTKPIPKPAPPPPPPLCLNRPEYVSLPSGMYKDKVSGNCYEIRGPDAIGTCDKTGGFHLIIKDQVAAALVQGSVMAIVVDGVGMVCLVSDVTTFHATPADYVDSKTFVEAGDTHFPLYACQTPFGDETVPFYKYYVLKGTVVTPTAKEEPGCKPAAKAKVKVKRHVRRHLSKKNQRRH